MGIGLIAQGGAEDWLSRTVFFLRPHRPKQAFIPGSPTAKGAFFFFKALRMFEPEKIIP